MAQSNFIAYLFDRKLQQQREEEEEQQQLQQLDRHSRVKEEKAGGNVGRGRGVATPAQLNKFCSIVYFFPNKSVNIKNSTKRPQNMPQITLTSGSKEEGGGVDGAWRGRVEFSLKRRQLQVRVVKVTGG